MWGLGDSLFKNLRAFLEILFKKAIQTVHDYLFETFSDVLEIGLNFSNRILLQKKDMRKLDKLFPLH